jgi:two-component system, OmpR family, response regulator
MKQLHHILCVDDEEDIQDIVKLCLELDDSLAIDICGGGGEAMAFLSRSRPDLILLDVMMPGMDGPATFAAMRQQGFEIPVIFMTARVHGTEVSEYLRLGAIGVIPKPFDPVTLAGEVKRLWSESLAKAVGTA